MFVYQMASEVSKRLDDINMLGRSITLKVMKRDPTAPVEPPKVNYKQIYSLNPGLTAIR